MKRIKLVAYEYRTPAEETKEIVFRLEQRKDSLALAVYDGDDSWVVARLLVDPQTQKIYLARCSFLPKDLFSTVGSSDLIEVTP